MCEDTGQQISSIMRKLSDGLYESVDSSALLAVLARVSKENRKHSRVRLIHIVLFVNPDNKGYSRI